MSPNELKSAAIELYGPKGFTIALAYHLKIHQTQVWRYLSGRTPIPGPVEAAITCWLQAKRVSH